MTVGLITGDALSFLGVERQHLLIFRYHGKLATWTQNSNIMFTRRCCRHFQIDLRKRMYSAMLYPVTLCLDRFVMCSIGDNLMLKARILA